MIYLLLLTWAMLMGANAKKYLPHCNSKVHLETVNVSPWMPLAGTAVSVTAQGRLPQQLSQGLVDVTLLTSGVVVSETRFDLCTEAGVACPLQGDFVATLNVDIPEHMPASAPVQVVVTLSAGQGEVLDCMDLDLPLGDFHSNALKLVNVHTPTGGLGMARDSSNTYVLAMQKCNGNSPWTLHGLWANWGQDCTDEKFDVNQLASIRDRMDKEWPSCQHYTNEDFWEHEWTKHGTCADGMSQLEFFSTALDLLDKEKSLCNGQSPCEKCLQRKTFEPC